ncbi:MAG: YicC/YloC family endoribonuclease [Nitrospinota bacterium]
MIYSMTGFSKVAHSNSNFEVTMEIKSVNSRHIDVAVRSSHMTLEIEDKIRKSIKKRFKRGYFDIRVQISKVKGNDKSVKLEFNKALFAQYKTIIESINLSGSAQVNLNLADLINNKDLFIKTKIENNLKADSLILNSLDKLLDKLEKSRGVEGKKTVATVKKRLATIESCRVKIKRVAKKNQKVEVDLLKKRLAEISSGLNLDENRIAQEIVFLTEKTDITEELERLIFHLDATKDLLAKEEEVGRKLEFYMQELYREINTIGSKTKSGAVSKLVVSVKSEIEKIREQAQNLE